MSVSVRAQAAFGWPMVVAASMAILVGWSIAGVSARQAQGTTGVLGGTVESTAGPEAGVWVIAETDELETKFVKIVVTDDSGRFLMPDLPPANYDVWVRGYGLVDSEKVQLSPGQEEVRLTGVVAPTPAAAAEFYPGNYWYSLIEPPPKSDFPGTGPDGNGISTSMTSQAAWIDGMKQGCQLCHQLGNTHTRVVNQLDDFDSSIAAWDHRVQTGQRGDSMNSRMTRFGRQRALEMFADWSDRIAAGELPPVPPRPQGIERNVVLTLWDWGTDDAFIHDEAVTDKRNPTVNANGPAYGVSAGHGTLVSVDPVTHSATELTIPVRPDPSTMPTRFPQRQLQPSYYLGDRLPWGVEQTQRADPHNPMLDSQGRVWMTSAVRGRDNPEWCQEGSEHPSATNFPLSRTGRQASYYDPERERFVLISTCFGTHHLQFAEDDDETLYFSGGGDVIGWINTRMYDDTGDEQLSQGWCPGVLDTNGDGQATKPWNEPPFRRASRPEPRHAGARWRVRHHPKPGRRFDLGEPDRALPRQDRPARARRQPARDLYGRGLRAPVDRESRRRPGQYGPRTARDRRGPERHHLDGALRQRSYGELRPQQVRHHERTGGDRAALPGRLDAVCDAWPPDEGCDGSRQRGFPLFQLGRPVRYARPG